MTQGTPNPWTMALRRPRQLSREEGLELGRLNAVCFSHTSPGDPPLNPETEAAALAQDWGDENQTWLLLARMPAGTLVGVASLESPQRQNTDRATLNVLVLPQERRRGLGRCLAERLAREALGLGRTTYSAFTDSRAEAAPFALRLGARAALSTQVSELRLETLDLDRLTAWVTRPSGDPYRLKRFEWVPPEDLERVARVNDVMNTAPRGELEFEDWVTTAQSVEDRQRGYRAIGGRTMLYVVEHLSSQRFVAFTQVGWMTGRAALVEQWGTGVHPEHRGRGLGKWLKAAVLRDLPRRNPEARTVRTGNADVNAAMLGINRALGFVPAFHQMEWQGQTQELLQAAGAGATL